MNTCIAILALGEACYKHWNKVFAPSVRAYAARHDYTVEVLTKPLDKSRRAQCRHPAWQKLLIAEQPEVQKYDRVVYLDTDVMVNPTAPAIDVPRTHIGAVTWRESYSEDQQYYEIFRTSWTNNGLEWIRNAKLQSFGDLAEAAGYPRYEDWINTGVLVYSPDHAGLLRRIYDQHEESPQTSFEQQAVSYELCVKHRDVLWSMDRRWNVIWYFHRTLHYPFLDLLTPDSFITAHCVKATLERNFALHFAADGHGRPEATAFMDQLPMLEVAA